ncbi:hypothetical protein D7V90_04055 [bacterium 1xD42-87]|nr:hypothetical protein D7V90_04055 [bacterium 1xD42-87]
MCAVIGINSYTRIKTGMIQLGVEEAQMAASIAGFAVDGDNSIKEAVGAVNIAVSESANGIVGVTEMASDMTVSMESIKDEAESNRDIAGQLESEAGKFKL